MVFEGYIGAPPTVVVFSCAVAGSANVRAGPRGRERRSGRRCGLSWIWSLIGLREDPAWGRDRRLNLQGVYPARMPLDAGPRSGTREFHAAHAVKAVGPLR